MKQKQATHSEISEEEPEQSPAPLRKHFSGGKGDILSASWSALKLFAILLLICGVLFPALVYGLGQLLFPDQANGSLLYNQQHRSLVPVSSDSNLPVQSIFMGVQAPQVMTPAIPVALILGLVIPSCLREMAHSLRSSLVMRFQCMQLRSREDPTSTIYLEPMMA